MSYATVDDIHNVISEPGHFCIRITDSPETDDWRSFYWSRDQVRDLITELKQILTMDDEKETK